MTEDTQKSVESTENTPEENEENEALTEAQVEVKDVTGEMDKLKTGMVVRVHQKIREITPKGDERERIQVFEGTIIAKKGQDKETATITVRKVSKGFGVERIFPLRLPTIAKIETVKELRVRRSKLYYTRDRRKKKLKEIAPKGTAKK